MAEWSEGYFSDIDYTYGYFGELNPHQLAIPLLNAGLPVPKVETACELGFGQGISLNAHAAGSDITWYGTDFNPNQASFASHLARTSEADAHIFNDAFLDFCQRSDLPDFDFISLHGIWSWISHENRQVIVDFVRRKLKLGGVLYISYNTLPGWSAAAPLRQILAEHDEVMGSKGQSVHTRVDASLQFAERLIAQSGNYRALVPSITERLKQIAGHNRQYLAHEYFNRHWLPMYFSDLANWLAPAKVNFACAANIIDDFDAIHFNDAQHELLSEINDAMFRQTVRDYMLNKQFRKDLWMKGGQRLNHMQVTAEWRELDIQLVQHQDNVSDKLLGNLGELSLNESIYRPLIAELSDQKAHNIADLEAKVLKGGMNNQALFEVISVLHGKGSLAVVQDSANLAQVQHQCDRINEYFMRKSLTDADIPYMVSPATGGAVSITRFSQMFAHATLQGKKSVDELAQFVWQILEEQGQRVVREGNTLQSHEENLAALKEEAQVFVDKVLPVLKSLSILPSSAEITK